jgi:putative hydrolase of the HAD superfamily
MARHVVFDFFGTLVSYRDGVRDIPVRRARALLAGLGDPLPEVELADTLAACFEDLEARSTATLREFSMLDAARLLFGRRGIAATAAAPEFVEAYLEDWVEGVEGLPRLAEWLNALDAPKSVLSNTHHEPMLRRQLERFGIDGAFCCVTTSIGHGMRKPHASIYRAHLAALGLTPADAVFVGDNPACDYFGPRAVGMAAYLVAEAPVPGVPEAHRLGHLYELKERLRD